MDGGSTGSGSREDVGAEHARARTAPEAGDLALAVDEAVERHLRRFLSPVGRRFEPRRVVARSRKGLVFLDIDNVWAFEAAGRLAFVHSPLGRFDLDVTLTKMEASLGHPFMRVHRNWLVDLRTVRSMERDGGRARLFVGADVGSRGILVPVSRGHVEAVRRRLLRNAAGLPAQKKRRRYATGDSPVHRLNAR